VPAAAALEDLVRRLGIARTLRQYNVLTSWSTIVGAQVARVTEAERVDKGVLTVRVATAAWRAELSMKRLEILEKIKAAVGPTTIHEIRFR
jgi:predicted nucleic acid-binding Zn ribbon protein